MDHPMDSKSMRVFFSLVHFLHRTDLSFFYRSQYTQSFLQNPYYFMYASLAAPDRDEELHLLKDGKTRCTTGSVVSSLYHLKDPEADSKNGTVFHLSRPVRIYAKRNSYITLRCR